MASRTARRSGDAASLPSRSRAGHIDQPNVDISERDAFLAKARESEVDEGGLDSSTLSAIQDRLRKV